MSGCYICSALTDLLGLALITACNLFQGVLVSRLKTEKEMEYCRPTCSPHIVGRVISGRPPCKALLILPVLNELRECVIGYIVLIF